MEGLKSKFFIFINLYLAGTHFGDVKLVEEAGEVKGGHPDGVPDTWSCSTVQQEPSNLLVSVSRCPFRGC